jgi:hypothetical protein
MAKTGAKYILWAPFKTPDTTQAAPIYDTYVSLSELAAANWTPTLASGEQYGDNARVESTSMVTGGALALEVTDLPTEIRGKIYGEQYDEATNSWKAGSSDVGPFGGVVYYKTGVRNSLPYFECYFYPKVNAAPSADSATTASSAITYVNDTLSLSASPRLNDSVYREVSDRFTTEEEAKAWCHARLGAL